MSIDSVDRAARFYQAVTDQTAKSVLDFFIDHPDTRVAGAAVVEQLSLSSHQDIARSTYLMGNIAAEQGVSRPWTEGQIGYLMSAEQAAILQQARKQL